MQNQRKIEASEVRYIKLGSGNRWAESSIWDNRIAFGHKEIPHELAASGDWETVKTRLSEDRARSPAKAASFLREIREFYTLGADCLWITFVDDKLWWAFAEPEVIAVTGDQDSAGARYRSVIGRWNSENIRGETISIHDLSSKLTKTGTYRQTLCRVEHAEYALRVINGAENPALVCARAAREEFTRSLDRRITITFTSGPDPNWRDMLSTQAWSIGFSAVPHDPSETVAQLIEDLTGRFEMLAAEASELQQSVTMSVVSLFCGARRKLHFI